MLDDATLDFRNPASRPRVLAALRREAEGVFALASVPEHWHTATACEGWQVRDMVGHLVDAIESYVAGFQVARGRGEPHAAVGVEQMAKVTDDAARAFRAVPRDDLLARLRDDFARLIDEFEFLTDSEWSKLLVADKYLGPLPAMVVAEGLLGGLTVHGWDIREGLDAPHMIAAESADLLVPFVFLLWRATADTTSVQAPFSVAIRTTGPNGGDTRIDVTSDGCGSRPAAPKVAWRRSNSIPRPSC